MKHHIAIKFLAILLAAACLLTAAGCVAGALVLEACDLYEKNVDEVYAEVTANQRRNFAVNLVHRYASLELGKLPHRYWLENYSSLWLYNTYVEGRWFYTIRDEGGNVVESTVPEELSPQADCYEIVVTDIRYRCLVEDPAPSSTEPTMSQPQDWTTPTMVHEETLPNTTGETEAAEEPVEMAGYYDWETDQFVEFRYRYEKLPVCTVELYLLPGALPMEPGWQILKELWGFRVELFYLLGISLLLFAAVMVYLCCAAGKKPGVPEVKAGGLNRLPLDLYAAVTAIGCPLAVILGVQVAEFVLVQFSPTLFGPFLLFGGLGLSLLVVAFCFACAAQFKTADGFWWRNTLICRSLILLRSFVKVLWRWTRNILSFSRKLLLLWIRKLNYALSWIGRRLAKFYGMLPLTWQWLLVGLGMLLMVIIGTQSRNKNMVVFPLFISLGIILYGAAAFGILLKNAKKMRSGDLEAKISDQFLIGSFKEFAGELNGLADVAVVAAQKQLRSERMKTELITNVSHDIKTPLTSIINYVDLLSKPHTPEEGEAYLEVLTRQSQRLKKLVEDLMEMSKASTGNVTVDITKVDAVEAVNQALGEFSDKLDRAGLVPLFRQEGPVEILADGRLLWRVLSNLLSNVCKYAMTGTRVYVDLEQEEKVVRLSLKNISRESLNVSAEELLERFVRGDASRNTEGSGLGLNIAKSLTEIQKGSLDLTVDGDLFKVTLTFPRA